ncbi:hypothetical protein PHYSODRAFT_511442 [Phytophthora sojae]|uniref:Deoxyuridine 5'-triphosphate nucleotidohydrolase n=1 Tax=Phytophthora sojae (strain P6497) TaxID=1094619 RepID=G4ZS64_PHYSP|nr:hypothetical protein PHYSODRAFT_511442 [Phytophthora sojae]EGZ14360.1 hypothetical protein PHYSODRAFT_511442 [Phytophthora sojae]|eukprot:XP_009531789.1 hypothetical protein PHYSODRAFT_511442 [Phytophthora sojae]
MNTFRVQPDTTFIPTRKTKGAAGNDIKCAETTCIKAGQLKRVPTKCRMGIPEGHVGLLGGRSGHTSKGIEVKLGFIDEDYRGYVDVMVKNDTEEDFVINEGDRFAQLII